MQTSYFSTILKDISWYYVVTALIISIYHGYRGYILQFAHARQQKQNNQIDSSYWTETKLFWVRDLYDAVFYFVCSFVGFISLKCATTLLAQITAINNISGGFSALIIFLLTIGFLGILGILPHIIHLGKLHKI